MKAQMRKLLSLFTKKERFYILVIFISMMVGAILESLGIGLILPFMSIVNDPDILHEHTKFLDVLAKIGLVDTLDILIISALALFAFFVFKNLFLGVTAYFQIRFAVLKKSDIACRLLKVYLNSPYTFHLQRNTAELLRNINIEVTLLFNNIIMQGMYFIKESLIVTAVIIILLILRPLPALGAILLLGGTGIAFFVVVRKKMRQMGKKRQEYGRNMIQWVNQSLGSIKETKILGREDFFLNMFSKNVIGDAKIYAFVQTAHVFPRLFLESTAIGAILLLTVFTLVKYQIGGDLLPTLALFAAASYRLLPSFNNLINSFNSIRFHIPALDVVHHDMKLSEGRLTDDSPPTKGPPISYRDKIELRNICYQYPGVRDYSLTDINLIIERGSSVAFSGPSGAGKTTIVDIILGLLKPTSGVALVDNRDIQDNLRSWQKQFGYIPQNIYLSDDTVRRNVAFGLEDDEIDDEKVWLALRNAQLDIFVNGLPNKLDTYIGEHGIRFSGGERQRIGIARALYNEPEILVMDEATSALDNETEKEIINTLKRVQKKKTIIIIAHRDSTTEWCDIIFRVESGIVVRGTSSISN